MEKMQNRILFDWFEMTSTIDSVQSIINALGLSDAKWLSDLGGCKGYRSSVRFGGISIFYDYYGFGADNGQRIKLEMTGLGCRDFEKHGNGDWYSLFCHVVENFPAVSVSRLDVAYDDFEYLLDMDKIVEDTRNLNFVSKFKSKLYTAEVLDAIGNDGQHSYTIYHGRKTSDVCFRIYDKLREQESKNKDVDTEHWVRFEMVLRRQRAFSFISLLCPSDEDQKSGIVARPLNELFFMVVNNYVRYIVPSGTDSNKWRADLAEHWSRFCQSVTDYRLSLWVSPDEQYDELRLHHYVECQCAGAVYTYIQLHSVDELIEVVENFKFKLNAKYQMLLNEHYADTDDNGCYIL